MSFTNVINVPALASEESFRNDLIANTLRPSSMAKWIPLWNDFIQLLLSKLHFSVLTPRVFPRVLAGTMHVGMLLAALCSVLVFLTSLHCPLP